MVSSKYLIEEINRRLKELKTRSERLKEATEGFDISNISQYNKFDYEFYLQTNRLEIELLSCIDLFKKKHGEFYTENLELDRTKLERNVTHDFDKIAELLTEYSQMKGPIKERENGSNLNNPLENSIIYVI